MKSYNEVYSKNDPTPVNVILQKGLNKVANAVKSTLGPAGNTVIIDRKHMGTITTKDGVTVAKSIVLENDVENIAATMLKQVAEKTVNEAGDGTTTATILAQALYNEGLKVLPFIKNRNDLKRSLEKYRNAVVSFIQSEAIDVVLNREGENKDLLNIAKISANGDTEMAEAIVEAFKMVGEEGIISVDDGIKDGYTVEHIDGLKVDAGMVHPYFMTDARKLECEQFNTCVLLLKDGLTSLQQIQKVLEYVGKAGKPITIFADNFTENVIELALLNKMKAKLDIDLIKVQGYGSNKTGTFEDIAAVTGATIVEKSTKPEDYIDCLGKATKIISNKNETRVISESKDEVKFNEHLEMLKTQLDSAVNEADRNKLETRISKLQGGVATIKVAGKTPDEVHEAKDRLDDALNAVRSALEEGIVPGSGSVFYNASKYIEDDGSYGYQVMKQALTYPIRTLCENAGENYEYVSMLLDRNVRGYGVDFSKPISEELVDLKATGIIDPAKVLRVALESAVSIVNLLLTSDNIITTINNEESQM